MSSRAQPALFATATLATPVVGAVSVPALYASVAVPLPVRGAFTYAVPASFAARVRVGARVAVRFGGQRVVAYVLDVSPTLSADIDASRVRPVLAVVDERPVFPPELLGFLREAADYYLHPLGEVLRVAAPAVDARAKASASEGDVGATVPAKGSLRAKWARVREETFVRLAPSSGAPVEKRRGDRQAQLLALLEARGEDVALSELRTHVKSATTVLKALVARGEVVMETREVPADPFFGAPIARDAAPQLTAAQDTSVRTIVASIEQGERAAYLLHGVTGSGKTEVYLRAVEAAERAGKGSLILLPEIALTPQLVSRYRARFGDDLAVLHSGLKGDARHAMWRRLHEGRCRVAIGARSAVFAPVPDLGLVIVDEEHDGSFKQDETFRYHGRDLALLRAYRAGCVCVLGSATPSVESYHAAQEGRMRYLRLPARATDAPMPAIELLDLARTGRRGPHGHQLLSLQLLRAIGETVARKEQVILFLNRRGFAPSVHCEDCGVAVQCPNCSVALVLHRREGTLKCHMCDHTVPYREVCPTCQGADVTLVGVGTERIEGELSNAFPQARVGRLDRDVASGRGAEHVLDRLRSGELDILVGTQMVTKGHDFPRVTLVGVLSADGALAFPDFRACERTFQLLAQVSGRAGRADLPGKVLIQTFQPGHPVLQHARSHDYAGFVADEVIARRELGYPPFGRLAMLRTDGPDEDETRRVVSVLCEGLRVLPEMSGEAVEVRGPAPSPIERVRGRYRFQALFKCATRPPLRRVLKELARAVDKGAWGEVRCSIDVDPVNML